MALFMGAASAPAPIRPTPTNKSLATTTKRNLHRMVRILGNFRTRVCFYRRPRFDRGHDLQSGRSRSRGDRAERADQTVAGGEPVPGHLAGVHDFRQASENRVREPMPAQIAPNPLD